ncbi:MAG: hypothetical protein ACXW2E_02010 [Nitrososphaeraceae archaeon]
MVARRTQDQFEREIQHRNVQLPDFQIEINPGSYYVNLDTEMEFVCKNGHSNFRMRPRHILQKLSGCPICGVIRASKSNTKQHDQFLLELENFANIKLCADQVYTGTYSKLEFECIKGHKFLTYPKTVISGHGCPICDKITRLKNYIDVSCHSYYCSIKDLEEFNKLTSQILDIKVELIPLSKSYEKYYYINKLKEAEKNNERIIFIFEDEWITNKELISSKLLHYSNQSDIKNIHARKCIIKQVSNDQKKILLDNNHVQGNDNAPLLYGAFYEDKLVAVMTFSQPRLALGAKGNREQYVGKWELSRFCTDTNYRIPGIASKLLKHFQRNNEWNEIYSFADRRWSVGNMYHQLGFDLVVINPPSYHYVIDKERKHRWNYRKDMLKHRLPNYKPELTEYENMVNHGFWRVWDCGTLKFSMKTNS